MIVAGQRKRPQRPGVKEFQEGLEDVGFGANDLHSFCCGFNHVAVEHGGKDGTAGRDDEAVRSEGFTIDKELNVGQLFDASTFTAFSSNTSMLTRKSNFFGS